MDKKYKVLLIEDEDSLRLVYSQYLTMEGFEVVEAKNGEVALEKAFEHHATLDIILLDVMLPKLDGIGVLTEVKNDQRTKEIPVYLMTVLATKSVIRKAFDLGADGYLVKDTMNPEDIKNEVINAIEGGGDS